MAFTGKSDGNRMDVSTVSYIPKIAYNLRICTIFIFWCGSIAIVIFVSIVFTEESPAVTTKEDDAQFDMEV